MKKILNTIITLLLLSYPVFSQMENIEEEVPVSKLVLKSSDIPASLKGAIEKSFKNGAPIQWYSFPYLLKEYGWAFKNNMNNMSNNSIPEQYAVQIT